MEPSPTELVDCPTCGVRNPRAEGACSACGKPLAAVIPPRPKVRRVGLATALVMVAVLAVCFGAVRVGPGLGVLVALWLVPAALRASLDIESRRAEGRPMRLSEKNDAIAASMMLAIVLLPAAAIAFTATCFPIGLVLIDTGDFLGAGWPKRHEVGSPSGTIVAMTSGVVAGIAASYLLGRKFWPRKEG